MIAALRSRLARTLTLGCLVATGVGCDALTRTRDEPAPAPVEAAPAEAAKPPSAPALPPSLLVGVIPQGIEPEVDGGSTFRVDAYVAALVVEQLRRSPQPFTPWRSDAAAEGQPQVGYRVGALPPDSAWVALGLREGDIVQAVNGVPAEGPTWASEALRRAENQVTVSVFRDDVSITLAYRLVGGLAWQSQVGAGEAADVLAVAEPPAVGDEPDAARGAGGGGGGGSGGGAFSGAYSPGGTGSGGTGSGGKGSGLGGGGGASGPTPTKAAVARCSSPDACTIDRAHFEGLVASPTKMQSQADVVPAIRDDVFSGYKLRTVKPGSTVAQLGFRSGDKVTHVNGRDLTNDAEALAVYLALSSTKTFKVRYVRDGQTRTKTIKVE